MPIWGRRRKPLHEELAEGTGLLDWKARSEAATPPMFKGTLDVLHGGRQREWDAVETAEAPKLAGDEHEFTVLPDGTLLVDGDVSDDALTPLADALEQTLEPPFRAAAVRRDGVLWGVAGNRIDVVELPDEIAGDTVSLAVQSGERTLLVDGLPAWESIPALERLGSAIHQDFVLAAERLDGNLWTVEINPL